MTPVQHLAQAVLDSRADLAAPLADAVLGLTFGNAFAIAEKARFAERERLAERLMNEADFALRHFGDLGKHRRPHLSTSHSNSSTPTRPPRRSGDGRHPGGRSNRLGVRSFFPSSLHKPLRQPVNPAEGTNSRHHPPGWPVEPP